MYPTLPSNSVVHEAFDAGVLKHDLLGGVRLKDDIELEVT